MIRLRLAALYKLMDEQKINVMIVKKPVNVHYLSGFRGDSTILIITRKRKILITDARYTEQAKVQAPDFELVKQEEGLFKRTAEILNELGLRSTGFEGSVITCDEHKKLKELAPKLKLKSVKLDELRQVKTEEEISNIRQACAIADKAFEHIVNFIKPGMTEIEVAARLEYVMRQLGSEKAAFDTIVASGLRGCYPHGRASNKKIARGEFVTMDFGAVYNGYNSDITRTICIGRADDRQRHIYNSLLKAQEFALTKIRIGAAGKAVDEAVRAELEKDGFAQFFNHGLGHGVGLEIHEEPRLSKTSTCEALKQNMIVTDEPGVYIPNFGGLRIEDTVLVTDGDAEPLTKCSKKLIEIM